MTFPYTLSLLKARNIFMKSRISIIIFTVLLVVLSSCEDHSLQEKKNIVIFTHFETNTQVFKNLMQSFNDIYSDTTKYKIYAYRSSETMSTWFAEKKYFIDESKKIDSTLNMLERRRIRPDIIITYGDVISHSAALSQHYDLLRTPVLCLDVMNPEYRGLIRKRRNFTVLRSVPDVKRNIEFIRDMGQSTWILTSLDSTYIDDFLRKEILRQLAKDTIHYATNLNLETEPRITAVPQRNSLRATIFPFSFQKLDLQNPDSVRFAGYKASELMRVKDNYMTFLRMKDDTYIDKSLSYNIGLYFTMTASYFNNELVSALNGCVGGYFTPWHEVARQASPVIDKILSGVPPSQITWGRLHRDYWLDYRLAKQIHEYAEDFPKGTRFINLPWYKRSRALDNFKNVYGPISLSVFLFLLIAIPATLSMQRYRQRHKLIRQGKEAQRLDEQIERIMDATNSCLWNMTTDKMLTFQTNVYQRWHMKPRAMSLNEIMKYIDIEYRERLHNALFNNSSESDIEQVEILCRYPHEKEKHALLIYIKHTNDENFLCRGIFMLNDAIYKAEKERKEARQKYEETKAKESFLAAMGHEIRNPLNAIVGFSRTLIDCNASLSEEERIAYGEYILQSNDQMLTLLNRVLDYSREKGDKIQLEVSRKSMAALMEDIYVIHSVIIPRHLAFNYEHAPHDIDVLVNRTSMMQVVSNLINNAIKFTEEGSITLGWYEEEDSEDKEKRWVVLYVEDTGIGISEEYQHRIFDLYYKENNYTQGAGIGLSLCKELVTNMGGKITVKSTLRVGTRFEVWLRVAPRLHRPGMASAPLPPPNNAKSKNIIQP